MAQPIDYEPRAVRTESTAQQELDRLLETCHRRGLLRFANDLVGAETGIAQVLIEGLGSPGAQNAVQNLAVLLMALSRVPPEQFYRVVFALRDALSSLAQAPPAGAARGRAPGVMGAYHLLQDDRLWRELWPLLEALHAFSDGLYRRIDNPISDFSGKRGRTQ